MRREQLIELLKANRLQAALTWMLGQVRCKGSHGEGSRAAVGKACPDCGACR